MDTELTEPKHSRIELSKSKNPAMQEISDYNDLLEWINEEAKGVLQIVDQPVTNKQAEYMNYLGFKTEFDKRQKIFLRLKEKEVSKRAEKNSPKIWQELEPKWRDIARRTREWLKNLDASLPSSLGVIGEWINFAEEMLEIEPKNVENHIEMADQLLELSNEHKDFFQTIDQHKDFFLRELFSPQQMDSLLSRLQVICKEAPKRENLLLYAEFRFRLSGFREAIEKKMEIWMSKLGTQEDVEEMVLDYKDFVQTNNLFANYDKMLRETNKRGDAFRKYVSKGESALIPVEDTQTWKKMSGQIKEIQIKFDTALEHWKRYNMCYDILIAWTTKGEQVWHEDTKEQIQKYFMDISHYEGKLKILKESATYLEKYCQKPIAEEIKENKDMINSRFMDLISKDHSQYRYLEDKTWDYVDYGSGDWFGSLLENKTSEYIEPFPRDLLEYEEHLPELHILKPLKKTSLKMDIQSHSELNQDLSKYTHFHSYVVSKAYDGEKIDIGLRVVRPYWHGVNFSNPGVLGTIIDIKDEGHVSVKWDNHDTETHEVLSDEKGECNLLLFNNDHTGVQHANIQCDACLEYPLRGIRWECLTCGDYDLCTQCYMDSKHNLVHEFKRFISMNSKGVNVSSRRQKVDKRVADPVKKVVKRSVEGIIQGSTVQLRNGSTSQDINVELWNSEKGKVTVKDKNGGEYSIQEINLKSGGKFSFYPDHLPKLKKGTLDYYFECDVGKQNNKSKHNKVVVHVWRSIQQKQKLAFKPCLYLIFANSRENKIVDKFAIMNEVAHFAKETKLPCHVLGQRVLFHSGSTNTACIHYKTCSETIKELIEKGFNEFERAETLVDGKAEDEIDYFKTMAEHVTGEQVLPVIISYSRLTEVSTNKTALSSKIPIIQLKKNTHGVSVMWCVTGDDNKFGLLQEYETDIIKPWRVKQSKSAKNNIQQDQRSEEYLLPSEIPFGLDALVCNCLIGVCIEEERRGKRNDMEHINVNHYALSMYLLTKEKWGIPNRHRKPHSKKPLDQKSLEYIYEQVVTSKMIHNLWYNQKSFVEMKYEPPEYLEDDKDSCGLCSGSNKDVLNTKGIKIKLKKWESECYGLIFFALLQKRLWAGATQLIETGHIGIHHILFGCVILDDEISSWRTTTVLKEKLERLKSAFTERAIRITSCIDDADKKIENTEIEAYEGNKKDPHERYIIKETEEEEQQQEDNINHAARLLLNHGYLKDAIVTENNIYVECQTVNNILNEMWYGTERINGQTIFGLIVLAAVHLFVLPLLMINMEARPLSWFYKKYNLPFLKVIIHLLGFFVLLLAYAYMLLFDYNDNGITYTDWFIIVWIASFFVDEMKQVIIAIIRQKWKSYASDWWNRFDWMVIIGYTFGMILRTGEGPGFRITSKCLLLFAFTLLCIRVLNFCCMTSFLGPKLVIIRKMIKDTVAFMIIMAVILIWYSVSYYALLYPNSEFTWEQIEHILSNGYWVLFGELNLDGDTLTEPDCTFNRTLYESGVLQRCPDQFGLYLTPYLKAFYGLIAVVLLLNLLIAIYSDTYADVQKNSKFYWSEMQMCFLEEYSIKTVFPVHLQLLALPGIIVAIIAALRFYLRTSNTNDEKKTVFNHHPMCVRVFLYDTNYDLRLESTEFAEDEGAQEARGKIDIDNFDENMNSQ